MAILAGRRCCWWKKHQRTLILITIIVAVFFHMMDFEAAAGISASRPSVTEGPSSLSPSLAQGPLFSLYAHALFDGGSAMKSMALLRFVLFFTFLINTDKRIKISGKNVTPTLKKFEFYCWVVFGIWYLSLSIYLFFSFQNKHFYLETGVPFLFTPCTSNDCP